MSVAKKTISNASHMAALGLLNERTISLHPNQYTGNAKWCREYMTKFVKDKIARDGEKAWEERDILQAYATEFVNMYGQALFPPVESARFFLAPNAPKYPRDWQWIFDNVLPMLPNSFKFYKKNKQSSLKREANKLGRGINKSLPINETKADLKTIEEPDNVAESDLEAPSEVGVSTTAEISIEEDPFKATRTISSKRKTRAAPNDGRLRPIIIGNARLDDFSSDELSELEGWVQFPDIGSNSKSKKRTRHTWYSGNHHSGGNSVVDSEPLENSSADKHDDSKKSSSKCGNRLSAPDTSNTASTTVTDDVVEVEVPPGPFHHNSSHRLGRLSIVSDQSSGDNLEADHDDIKEESIRENDLELSDNPNAASTTAANNVMTTEVISGLIYHDNNGSSEMPSIIDNQISGDDLGADHDQGKGSQVPRENDLESADDSNAASNTSRDNGIEASTGKGIITPHIPADGSPNTYTAVAIDAAWSQFMPLEAAERCYLLFSRSDMVEFIHQRLDRLPSYNTFFPTVYAILNLAGSENRIVSMKVTLPDSPVPITIKDDSYKSYEIIMDGAKNYMRDESGNRKFGLYWIRIVVQVRE